jgi:3-oxoadipate enol-lactonase
MQVHHSASATFHVETTARAGRPAIVFVNSLGTDFRIWDDVIARLGDRWTTLRYDKRGHGLSDVGDEPCGIADHAQDLGHIMEASGIRRAVVCGVSIGGMIAQALYDIRPDLVAGLLLSNTAHRIGTPEFWASRIAAIEAQGLEGIADGVMQRWFSPAFLTRHPHLVRLYRTMMARTPQDGYIAACAAIRDADLTEAARAISVPTLCLAGGHDGATPPDLVKSLADLIPGARYELLPDCAHLPSIERPDIVADRVEALTKEVFRV